MCCPCGIRRIGGVSLLHAFTRNERTCRHDGEGKTSSNGDCKRESTDAWHGVGTSRSSEEAAVVAAEQRGSIVRSCQGEKLTSSGGIETDKAKPFSISRQGVYASYRKVSSNNGSGA